MPGWSPVDLLPGIWFGLLALLLLAALARWYDRVPWPAAAAFLAVVALLFGPALAGGGILLPLDNLRGQAPFRELPPTEPHGNPLQGDLLQLVAPSGLAVREACAEGRWPLWNSRVGAGMPLLGDPQAQALQPLVLLAYALPYARAAGVTAALRVWVALVFTFLLLRRLGLHAGPAAAGALAFGLGGFLVLWVGWPMANSAALLPAALYAVVRCGQEGKRRDYLLLALATFGLLTGGHPETIVYALALVLAFLLARARNRPPGRRLSFLREAGLALLLAAGAAAPVLLAAATTLPDSLRAARLREKATTPAAAMAPGLRSGPAPPASRLVARWLPTAVPNSYGNSRYIYYWGLDNTNEDAGGFAGTATLLAALLALVPVRRRLPQEKLLLLAAGVALGLMSLGVAIPAVGSRWPALAGGRLHLIVVFALACLGAFTFERALGGELPRGWTAAFAVALALLLVWAYLAHSDPASPDRLALLRFGWLRWQLRFLALAALLLLAGRGRRWTPPALAILIACELLLAHRAANPAAPKRLLLPENAALRFLAEHLEDGQRIAALGPAFPPNLPALYELADARVYNPAAPAAYIATIAPITTAWGGEVPRLGNPTHPLYPRLGVRYLLAEPGQSCPPPLVPVFADSTATLCEVPAPRPALFLAGPGRLALSSSEGAHHVAQLAGASTLLGTTLFQDGSWRLLLDGRLRSTLTKPQDPFLAANLPAGIHRLDLLYRPAWLASFPLAALALALAAARWTPPPRDRAGRRPNLETPGGVQCLHGGDPQAHRALSRVRVQPRRRRRHG
jgi:hypothetical protein